MADTHNGAPDGASRPIEERLRFMIDQIPALVWSKLPDGSLDFFNQRFREYTGLSLEDGLGWGWINAFHPDDRRIEEWRAALEAGEPFEKEARLRSTDGKYRWFVLRAIPVKNDQGVITKWYGTSTDIQFTSTGVPSVGTGATATGSRYFFVDETQVVRFAVGAAATSASSAIGN